MVSSLIPADAPLRGTGEQRTLTARARMRQRGAVEVWVLPWTRRGHNPATDVLIRN
jgi:hypothetical protein